MHFKNFVGIDVSKRTFNAFILHYNQHKQFTNTRRGFDLFINWLQKHLDNRDLKEILVSFEHTGLYSLPLALHLQLESIPFSMISALQIKRSMGMVRGKKDKADAKKIA